MFPKKGKTYEECRAVQKKWKTMYFFVDVNGKPTCLICSKQLSVAKVYNVRRHYLTNHSLKYSKYTGKTREDKVTELEQLLLKQQTKLNKGLDEIGDLASKSSYTNEFDGTPKLFLDGNFIEKYFSITTEDNGQEKRNTFFNVNLSRNAVTLDSNINDEMKDRNPAGVFQDIERGPTGEVEEPKSLQNCIAFVNVNQIKTEEEDPVDVHDEPLQPFHQQSSHIYPDTSENFSPEGKREKSSSPTITQEPDSKRLKFSSKERTDDIISAINRLERILISETHKRQEDLFDVFGRSVSDQLRQLPRRQAIMAQSKIQNVLIQEFLEYDSVNSSKTQEQPP